MNGNFTISRICSQEQKIKWDVEGKITAILIFHFAPTPISNQGKKKIEGGKYEERNERMENRDPFLRVVELKASKKKKKFLFSFAHSAENSFPFLKFFLSLKFEGIKQAWHVGGLIEPLRWLPKYWFVWIFWRWKKIERFYVSWILFCFYYRTYLWFK